MRSGNLVAAALLAVVLSACAVLGGGPPTALKNDVASGCIESRAAYGGYRLSCITLGCPALDKQKAVAIQDEAKAFCDRNPPSTAGNLKTIKSLVARQRAVGRKP